MSPGLTVVSVGVGWSEVLLGTTGVSSGTDTGVSLSTSSVAIPSDATSEANTAAGLESTVAVIRVIHRYLVRYAFFILVRFSLLFRFSCLPYKA
jgi:hypothetical protein